jgi:anti-sigma factor RsiW
VSELHAREVAPWLEMELARQLAPVAAPDALWDRIHEQRLPQREKPGAWAWWSIAAALLLVASGAAAWRIGMARNPGSEMAKLAEHELHALANSAASFDLRSDDPKEIRSWVKEKANIDIELPAEPSAVQLLGARLLHLNGAPVAAIAYRVGDDDAALLVTGKGSAATTRHVFARVESSGSARLFSWSMRRQEYSIAFAATKDPQGACLLCHANARGLSN